MSPTEGPAASGAGASASANCPSCGEPLVDDARFCEACGHDLIEHSEPRIITSLAGPAVCDACGGVKFTDQSDGGSYCDNCGVRRPAGRPHTEADLDVIAAASDIGKRHHNNEDAFGIARLPSAYVGVVCDGVSSSGRADTASHPAADAAARTFVRMLDSEAKPDATVAEAATLAAAEAAQAAATVGAGDADGRRGAGSNPPSTTFVSAVVTTDGVTIGWVGDSRAYWIGDDGESACLTVDDTLGGQLAAAGIPVSDEAPNVAALIRWLGADATDAVPHIAAFQPNGPGRVIVCSDGLYRYAPMASELAAVTPSGSAVSVVRTLVQFALDAGGGDNVTVVVLPYPPREGKPE